VGLEVLTQQQLATATVEALHAELGVVGDDSLADVEALDGRADGGDDADGLVAGNQGELGEEFAFVDVEVL
jgi:hypothetical protein